MTGRVHAAPKAATLFGAALAGLSATPAAAEVVPLTFLPSSLPFGTTRFIALYTSETSLRNVGRIRAYNRTGVTSFGAPNATRTFAANDGSGFRLAPSGSPVTTGQAFFIMFGAFNPLPALRNPGSTTLTFGILTGDGDPGWIRMTMQDQGPISYEGAIEVGGTTITSGSLVSDVPLPATLPLAGLGVLALGAAGLRRRRRAVAASA